jgi:hypothetical protein
MLHQSEQYKDIQTMYKDIEGPISCGRLAEEYVIQLDAPIRQGTKEARRSGITIDARPPHGAKVIAKE